MTTIRVKRPRTESPVDVLVIDPVKRSKSLESIMSDLSLSGTRQIYRRVSCLQKNPASFGFTKEVIEERKQIKTEAWHRDSMEKRYEQASKLRETYVLAATTDVILCDGKPLTRYRLHDQSADIDGDYIEEEYERVRAPEEDFSWLADGIIEMNSADCSEDNDSEDSNCEGQPWNEYPDEESSKSSSDTYESGEKEDYADHVVDYDSDIDSDW